VLWGAISLTPVSGQFAQIKTATPSPIEIPKTDKEVLIVGDDNAYPPYSFLENGTASGFDNDLIRAMAEVMGVEVQFQLTSWAEVKQNLLDGKIDVIGGMAYSEERAREFEFGNPHTVLFFDLFVQRNSPIHTIDDMKGKQIVVQRGGLMREYLNEVKFIGEVNEVDDPLDALNLVASGMEDGALLNKMQGYYFIKSNRLSNLKSIGANLQKRNYGVVAAKDNRSLIQELNQALAVLENNGAYNQLNAKWFGVFKQEGFLDQFRYYIYGAVALLTAFLVVVFGVWSLRRQVRKQTRELRTSEEKYRRLIDNATEGVVVIRNGQFVYLNPQARHILGYSTDTSVETLLLSNILHPLDFEQISDYYKAHSINEGDSSNLDYRIVDTKGSVRWLRTNAVGIEWEEKPAVLGFFSDVTDEKMLQESLRSNEERYRLLFTNSPVGLFYYDQDLNITNINDRMIEIFHTSREKVEHFNLHKITDKRILPAICAVLEHVEGFYEGPYEPTVSNEKIEIYIMLHTTPLFNENHEFQGGIGLIEDITDRVTNEHKIEKLEEKFTKAFLTSPDAININRLSDGMFIDINRGFTELTGYTHDEVIGKSSLALNIWANPKDRERLVRGLKENGEVKNLEALFRFKNGQILTGLMSASMINIEGEPCILSVTRDISELKKSEGSIRASEARYRSIFETVPVSIWEQDFLQVYDMLENLRSEGVTNLLAYLKEHPEFVRTALDSIVVKDINEASLQIFKAKTKEELSVSIGRLMNEESLDNFKFELLAIWEKRPVFDGETVNLTLEGDRIIVNVILRIPEKREDFNRVLVSIADITERKQAEEQIKQQVQHLAALRAVDMAISANMDLPTTLRVLLNQVTHQLGVDSASILLYNPSTQKLDYGAGIGFKTNSIESTSLQLGQSYAGQAALERRIIAADDLSTKFSQLFTKDIWKEKFSSYLGVPLISKGDLKGVLELFNRASLPQTPDWMNLMESMAGQAAIAIENATLVDEIQQANKNLRQAYDATIEGWARALELRDGDTEGHSIRVADLSVGLARMVGYQGDELLNVRRGALLHDIGKMGIPDHILLNPEGLTEEEWKIMRMHPTFGRQFLQSIDFLQPAIEIPYGHHERWDGTGYPQGLNGNSIPFIARVFSVVDCWDALRSDRPYREAWSDEKAWQYIAENSGKAFDPEIVEKFKELLGIK
jgi:PAS domain S-box-containing protein/putative nucleotidyltransferase with HDIG domain